MREGLGPVDLVGPESWKSPRLIKLHGTGIRGKGYALGPPQVIFLISACRVSSWSEIGQRDYARPGHVDRPNQGNRRHGSFESVDRGVGISDRLLTCC